MRTRMCVVVGLVAAALGIAGAQTPEFKVFASEAGRYKVLFPGPVKSETVPVKTEKEELKLAVDSVELRGGTTFLVTYIDAPESAAKQPAAARLDKVRDGNKGDDGKLIGDKEVTVGTEKHPARDVLIEKPGGCIRNRIVLAGNRLYQVMVQGPKDVVTSASADRFIESFEVTK